MDNMMVELNITALIYTRLKNWDLNCKGPQTIMP